MENQSSVLGDGHRSRIQTRDDSMRTIAHSRNLIPCFAISAICVLSFTFGYFVRGLRNSTTPESKTSQVTPAAASNSEESRSRSKDISEYDSLLATIKKGIDPDNWLESGGTSTIEPLPSNIVGCTAEDIFGSREAYLKMFDVSTEQIAAENDPFVFAEEGDPFSFTVDQ